jgi:hypothetical protein
VSTLIVFFGIDKKPSGERGHASAYLASDSWITDIRGEHVHVLRDDAQKVFASRTQPAIFGYVGDERVEVVTRRLVEKVDQSSGGILMGSHDSIAKACAIESVLLAETLRIRPLNCDSRVIYVGLDGVGNNAEFHAWLFTFNVTGASAREELFVPKQSGPPLSRNENGNLEDMLAIGSGANLLAAKDVPKMGEWHRQENLVCAYYRALRHALSIRHDSRSGGMLQIATLQRSGRASYVGVVDEGVCYVAGRIQEPNEDKVSRLVDQDFDEID